MGQFTITFYYWQIIYWVTMANTYVSKCHNCKYALNLLPFFLNYHMMKENIINTCKSYHDWSKKIAKIKLLSIFLPASLVKMLRKDPEHQYPWSLPNQAWKTLSNVTKTFLAIARKTHGVYLNTISKTWLRPLKTNFKDLQSLPASLVKMLLMDPEHQFPWQSLPNWTKSPHWYCHQDLLKLQLHLDL